MRSWPRPSPLRRTLAAPMSAEVSVRQNDQAAPTWVEGEVPESLADAAYSSALVEANRQRALFRLQTVGRFLIEPGRPTIVERAAGATDQDVACFWRGPVAALRLCLCRQFALRGAAAQIDGRAVAVCGIATGTSSLVARLALDGHPVLADGVIWIGQDPPVLFPVPECQPPRVTLWPDSVEALGLDPASGEPVRPVLPSRAFVLGPPHSGPVPLGALVAVELDDKPEDATVLQRLRGFAAVSTVLKSFWHPHLAEGLGMAREQFHWASAIAGATPTAYVNRPPRDSGERLGAMIKAFVREVQ